VLHEAGFAIATTCTQILTQTYVMYKRIRRTTVKADFQSSHEAPRSSLRVLASNSNELFSIVIGRKCSCITRSELRGASCEDWKSALSMPSTHFSGISQFHSAFTPTQGVYIITRGLLPPPKFWKGYFLPQSWSGSDS
jgi:hypothetical protein